jgi:predicted AAA+ superfamily ATPase
MDKSLLKTIIADNMANASAYDVSPRDFRLEDAGNYVFVGIRRAGKSYLLYQQMQKLLAGGTKPQQMLYVNFEDERLSGISSGDLNLLLEAHLEMYGTKPTLFLDEIQNVKGWE